MQWKQAVIHFSFDPCGAKYYCPQKCKSCKSLGAQWRILYHKYVNWFMTHHPNHLLQQASFSAVFKLFEIKKWFCPIHQMWSLPDQQMPQFVSTYVLSYIQTSNEYTWRIDSLGLTRPPASCPLCKDMPIWHFCRYADIGDCRYADFLGQCFKQFSQKSAISNQLARRQTDTQMMMGPIYTLGNQHISFITSRFMSMSEGQEMF